MFSGWTCDTQGRERNASRWAHALIFPNGGGLEMTRATALRFFQRQFEGGFSVHGFRSTLEGSKTIQSYRRTDYFDKRRALMEAWVAYVTA